VFFFSIRRRRIEELKNRAAKEQQWRSQGDLEYTELRDEKEWFEASRENERMVCHFYRGVTWRCQIVDRHLETLAKKHIETKFCKVGYTDGREDGQTRGSELGTGTRHSAASSWRCGRIFLTRAPNPAAARFASSVLFLSSCSDQR